MTPAEKAAYEMGYRDGENSATFDCINALEEAFDIEADGVAEAIAAIKKILADGKAA